MYFVHGTGNRRIVGAVNFVMRTSVDPSMLAAAVRAVIHDTDPTATVGTVEPLADRLSVSIAQPRFATTVLIAFAGTALLLASIGLYGVLSTPSRNAGASSGPRGARRLARAVALLVVTEGLSVTLIGLVVGLVASAALTRYMQAALFGVRPLDPASFVAAPIALIVVAMAACLRPAIRAASVDPAGALRTE